MAEKELAEMDKKKVSTAAASVSADTTSAASNGTGGSSTGMRDRLAELSKHIAEEARKLAVTRAELLKVKGTSGTTTATTDGSGTIANSFANSSGGAKSRPGPKKKIVDTAVVAQPTDKAQGGRHPKNFSDELTPELAK